MIRALVAGWGAVLATVLFAPPAVSATAIDGYIVVDDANTGQIYTVTQLGSDFTQVTHLPDTQFAIAPRWSPDGGRIGFVIVAHGVDRMFTMAADGSDVHKIRADGSSWNNDVPDFFPDGTRVAFARCHTDGSGCTIDTVGVDGTGLRRLTPPLFEVYDFAPDVSPDGGRIAFVRFNADGVHSQIWVMNSDGSGAHPITAPRLEGYQPFWSPDGTTLSVGSNCCRLGGNLYRVPAGGGTPTQLTHTPYPNFSGVGSYAPSGREIAFVSDRFYPDKDGADLFVMRADGAHQVKVNLPLAGVGTIDWGPSPIG